MSRKRVSRRGANEPVNVSIGSGPEAKADEARGAKVMHFKVAPKTKESAARRCGGGSLRAWSLAGLSGECGHGRCSACAASDLDSGSALPV